jgi:hypothetical protein
MTRVPWKEDKVVSIETRAGVFVLTQMLRSPYLAIFNAFRTTNQWDDIDSADLEVLFCKAVTRQFISSSNVQRQHLQPARLTNYPKYWIELNPETVEIAVWANTPHERRVHVFGKNGGKLIERDITIGGSQNRRVVQWVIPYSDRDTIGRYELTDIEVYPAFNERLYLCHALGRNVDPMKELVFRYPIPHEYETYLDIIGP